jgi:hypothetical protein
VSKRQDGAPRSAWSTAVALSNSDTIVLHLPEYQRTCELLALKYLLPRFIKRTESDLPHSAGLLSGKSLTFLAHIKKAGVLKFLALVVVHFTALKGYIIQIVDMLATGVLEDFTSTRPVDACECQPSHELYYTASFRLFRPSLGGDHCTKHETCNKPEGRGFDS